MSYVRYEALTSVILKIIIVWLVAWWNLMHVSEELSASIFRVEE
jgi:hypothetical protein